jgi:8-oxo-dGTP diphosphatase
MRLLIVRHAVALRREDWKRDDRRRPLTPKGEQQALGLVDLLAGLGVDRIYSSPFVRCVDTVQPLAAKLALPVEETHLLAERAGAAIAPHVVDLGGDSVVLCSHGDVIPELLEAFLGTDADRPCEKGSTWVIDDVGGDRPRPRYLPPPV